MPCAIAVHVHKIDVVIHTLETTDLIWRLNSGPSCPVGFSIQDEAMDAALSAPQESYHHADFINMPP